MKLQSFTITMLFTVEGETGKIYEAESLKLISLELGEGFIIAEGIQN